ncbi:hypothetical protein ABZX77_51715 [Streptomyces sp. NPDC004237]|uniref:hypothetical protein n=1 Tax=Streptomyces sp. NPDC004237 TaxID=3154455 RepID=UPI0033AD3F32
MVWTAALAVFTAGALIAVVTAPVGVWGVVFLLSVRLGVLGVRGFAVMPANVLFGVVAGLGALLC